MPITIQYDLQGAIGVKMYYDAARKAVAFKFIKTKEDGMMLLKMIRPRGAYISGRSFIGKYKIDQAKYAGRYEPREVKDDSFGKLYVIELKEKGTNS